MTAVLAVRRLPFKAAPIAALLIMAALFAARTADDDATSSPPSVVGEALTILTADGTTARLQAEIAESLEQRSQGLMRRTSLAPDSGMLFIIEPPGRGFWMKDTPLSLTVAFIADCGEIVDFADLDPLSEEVKNTEGRYVFALEMERGWFAANQVAVGDVIQLPQRLQAGGC